MGRRHGGGLFILRDMEKKDSNRLERIGIVAVLVILACQMWDSNTDMFLRMAEAKGEVTPWGVARCVFLALAYSTLTAMVIRKLHRLWHKLVFGFLDGFTVFMHFQSQIDPKTMIWIGSPFYAIYSFYLIYIISIRRDGASEGGDAVDAAEAQPGGDVAVIAPSGDFPATVDSVEVTYRYTSLNSLIGALNRSTEPREDILMRAKPEIVQQYLSKHPEYDNTR